MCHFIVVALSLEYEVLLWLTRVCAGDLQPSRWRSGPACLLESTPLKKTVLSNRNSLSVTCIIADVNRGDVIEVLDIRLRSSFCIHGFVMIFLPGIVTTYHFS